MTRKQLILDYRASNTSNLNQFNHLNGNVENNFMKDTNPDNAMKSTNVVEQDPERSEIQESQKPPPIFMADVCDISGLLYYLKTKINIKEFTYKSQRDGNVGI